MLLGVLALAYLQTISAPLFKVFFHLSALGHFPLMLSGPVLALHFGGLWYNSHAFPWQTIFRACWSLLLLAVFALLGSAVAKWELNIDDSFLAFGVYIFLLPFFMLSASENTRARHWVVVLMSLGFLVSLAALAGEVARYKWGQTFLHEIQYIVVAGFFAVYYVVRSNTVKLLMFLLIVLVAVLNQKLTGFLVVGLAILHIVVTAGWRRFGKQWRIGYMSVAAILVMSIAAVAGLLYFEFREHLPSGNPEVRLQQYQSAMREFVDSPLWGNAYTSASGEIYNDGYRRFYIPTHGDVLDMLKHGGLIAFTLFFLGYWKIFFLIHSAVKATREDRVLNAYFMTARYFQVAALVTFTFNPLLLKGPFLFVIWANLGLAAGIAIGVLGRPKPKVV
jgi:O-antigen ligase